VRDCSNEVTMTPIEIESADPRNYYDVVTRPERLLRRRIDGRLYLPAGGGARHPVVVIVPGSLGIAPSHLAHAETLTGLGVAACVIDPFGGRSVTSTVANQAQYSFAASAYDVLATVRTLAARAEIDPNRIGAQGHSRGGSAVLTAAMRRFARPVLGDRLALRAVYAAYPWCGHQFRDPDVGRTVVRAVIGDRDDWCLPQQVQGHVQAIRLRGGAATMRLFGGAGHSFDRETPVERIEEAAVSPDSPTGYIDDDGALIHPLTDRADPDLTDRDLFVYNLKAGYGRRGATIGSTGDQPAQFRADMIAFWKSELLEPPS
jgi:dienelactone hydrolase